MRRMPFASLLLLTLSLLHSQLQSKSGFVASSCNLSYVFGLRDACIMEMFVGNNTLALNETCSSWTSGTEFSIPHGLTMSPSADSNTLLILSSASNVDNHPRSLRMFDIGNPSDFLTPYFGQSLSTIPLIKTYNISITQFAGISFAGCNPVRLLGMTGTSVNNASIDILEIDSTDGSILNQLVKIPTTPSRFECGRAMAYSPYDGYLYVLACFDANGFDDPVPVFELVQVNIETFDYQITNIFADAGYSGTRAAAAGMEPYDNDTIIITTIFGHVLFGDIYGPIYGTGLRAQDIYTATDHHLALADYETNLVVMHEFSSLAHPKGFVCMDKIEFYRKSCLDNASGDGCDHNERDSCSECWECSKCFLSTDIINLIDSSQNSNIDNAVDDLTEIISVIRKAVIYGRKKIKRKTRLNKQDGGQIDRYLSDIEHILNIINKNEEDLIMEEIRILKQVYFVIKDADLDRLGMELLQTLDTFNF